jgi:hypothetical protein
MQVAIIASKVLLKQTESVNHLNGKITLKSGIITHLALHDAHCAAQCSHGARMGVDCPSFHG